MGRSSSSTAGWQKNGKTNLSLTGGGGDQVPRATLFTLSSPIPGQAI